MPDMFSKFRIRSRGRQGYNTKRHRRMSLLQNRWNVGATRMSNKKSAFSYMHAAIDDTALQLCDVSPVYEYKPTNVI